MKELVNEVIDLIRQKFPALKVKYEIVNYDGEDETFIYVDNKEIYKSKEFLEFSYYLEYDYLFKRGEAHFYIVCEPEKFPKEIEDFSYTINDKQFAFDEITFKDLLYLLAENDSMELAA